ncbi:AAA family ATPase [Halococcus dombrowskii]|uniref:AAA family ATPase n=1 Tax=Halococcus dombrowskii TaxID=179637 RepID=A0AAX3AIP1_HALDO|nr:AAA family ATPase [Halococcus dombrowskii]UOO93888.1 AAA family ATPase [Halococcus dombrowskii]
MATSSVDRRSTTEPVRSITVDLAARIRRRRESVGETRVVLDYHAISPIAHVDEPTNRGTVLERLLDYVDPVFDGRLPPNAYVWGPSGSGKSAVVTALLDQLRRVGTRSGSVIHTSTRGGTNAAPALVYVDTRHASSEFGLYQTVLDGMLDESVPKHGVGTDTLRSRLAETLADDRRLLVAFDHVDEPGTQSLASLVSAFDGMADSLSWLAIGHRPPSELSIDGPPERIEVPAYRDLALVDILTARASAGMARRAIEHEQLRRIAVWADGNAHDALCVLFAAADEAALAGVSGVREHDLHVGMDALPRPAVSLGRVFALSVNRQQVLARLVEIDDDQRASVDAAATAVAATPSVELSKGTVKRLLYELAEIGIVERVSEERSVGAGRSPSRLEPRFPTRVFGRLHGLANA